MASFPCRDCSAIIPGTNCGYELSYQKKWKHKKNCEGYCKCSYPIRAKEIRSNIFTGKIDGDRKATQNAYIYCETERGGHVYYGTYNHCIIGNGIPASSLSSCKIFERYSGAN